MSKQFLLVCTEEAMVSLTGAFKGIDFLEVQGMRPDIETPYDFLVTPVLPHPIEEPKDILITEESPEE